MTKVAVAIPTVWVSTLWGEAWSAILVLVSLSVLFLIAAWKMRQIESEEKA